MDGLLAAINSTASSLRDVASNAVQRAAGKVGKAIDTIGKATGNVIPEVHASEYLEQLGAGAMTPAERQQAYVSQGKTPTELTFGGGTPTEKLSSLNSSSGQGNPTNSSSQTQEFTADQLKALGTSADYTSGDVRTINGQQYKLTNTGRGTTLLTPYTPPTGGGGGGNGGGTSVKQVFTNNPDALNFLNQEDVNRLMGKYGSDVTSNADALAKEIEDTARANAEREYQDVLSALGVQKQEVQTIGQQQRERIATQKEQGTQELEQKKQSETMGIQKEATQYSEDIGVQKDQLAQNWRDMSLQVQRIMRARGVQDSSYSSDKETQLLLDFNKGLRALATTSSRALKDFSDAVTETTRYYNSEQTKLSTQAAQADQDVDNWIRQQVESIQAQENKALSTKLVEIRDAISQGNQLKINAQQSIADKQYALDVWMVQTNTQFKQAVALAAQQKVSTAEDAIKQSKDLVDFAYSVLTKGGGELTVGADGKPVIHGSVFNPTTNKFDEFNYPVTSQFVNSFQTDQAYKQAQTQNAQFNASLLPGTATGSSAGSAATANQNRGLLSGILSTVGL